MRPLASLHRFSARLQLYAIHTFHSAVLLAIGTVLVPALAQPIVIPPQGDAGALQQRQINEDRRRRDQERLLPSTSDPLHRPDAPVTPQVSPPASTVRFEVREIRFSTSEILAPADLEAIAALYRGRQVSLDELQDLAGKVNDLYEAKGVVTAIATIQPQVISDGVVLVRLVEGRVGEVSISGNEFTRESYIRQRLGLVSGEIVDLNRLEESLVWSNRTNDLILEAELKPGKGLGSTDIFINAVEPDRNQFLATLNNLGSRLTGRWRSGVSYRNRSLFGFRDDLALAYTHAGGQDSWSAGYGFPINRWGGRVNLTYYDDATSIRYGSLSSLKITGRSQANVLTLRQPVYVKNNLQIDLTAGVKKRDSSNYIDTVFLQRTSTVDDNVGVDIEGSDELTFWGASVTHTQGNSKTIGNNISFKATKGSARYSRNIDSGWSLRSNLAWQYAKNANLASSEQFFIGGEGSVRGYDAGVYSGDKGFIVNIELHNPIGVTTLAGRALAVTGFFFLDFGSVDPFRPPSTLLRRNEHLTGLGYGVNMTLGKQTSLSISLARGIDAVPQAPQNNVVFSMQLVHSLY